MSRAQAKKTLDQRKINAVYAADGVIVNDRSDVPIDEAAPAYKSAEQVIATVVAAGLATVEYRLWPLASLKGLK
jgi:tRNA-splicing ligase RtcB